jgi:hypothetical protein
MIFLHSVMLVHHNAYERASKRREAMAKVICVLYDDPIEGYPHAYARDDLPTL